MLRTTDTVTFFQMKLGRVWSSPDCM